DQEDMTNKLSRDYVTGVNFLLSNQPEKAVDLFLDILQKQETENEIDSTSQFEAELTLGNLYRSRGEVDRALRIHQALDRSPDYTFEQKLLAKQQLAKDFMAVGFYDRAEMLYILLVDEPEFAENALQQLAVLYQKRKN
ncbi:tetratricopeptide repeat protein, partial [Pasteurella multocida subsp. multocida str. Anand1_buffalo]